jgi:hypothetical protein
MVTLWNPADEPQDLVFTLFFSGGHYQYPIHLEARAAHQFNVSEVIHNQIPDAEGNVVPVTVHNGSAEISGRQAENESILVAIDAGTYNVQKATCSYICTTCDGVVPDGTQLVDNPFAVGVAATYQLQLQGTWNTGAVVDYTGGATWTSSETSVGTVSKGLVTGVAAGALDVTAAATSVPQYRYVCTEANSPPPACPVLPAAATAPGTVGVTVTIFTSNCFNPDPNTGYVDLTAGWADASNPTVCGLADTGPALPSGGACKPNYSGIKNCYTVYNGTTNMCTSYCPGTLRTENSQCTKFLDSFPVVQTSFAGACP